MAACAWPLIRPGMMMPPRASIIFGASYCDSISADLPTATMESPRTATAPSSMMRRCPSMVTTVP